MCTVSVAPGYRNTPDICVTNDWVTSQISANQVRKLQVWLYLAFILFSNSMKYKHCINVCTKMTLAGAWIQMAGLNRMWSHSCLSSMIPFCKLLRYLEKASTMSRTDHVTCTLEDWKQGRDKELEIKGDEGRVRWCYLPLMTKGNTIITC